MARKDYIAELSRKPLGFKLAMLGGIAVLCGFLYWQFVYSGLSDDLKTAKNQTASLETKNDQLNKDKKEFEELVLKKKSLDEELRKNEVSLPASSELPSFFLHLQKQAAGAGVTLDNWRRLKESKVESYIRVPVAMEITGSFYQINNYFKLLYETDRIITVENMTLEFRGAGNGEPRLFAKFVASTFRLPDRPPDINLPEAVPAKPKGGKGQIKDANKQRGNQLDNAANAAGKPGTTGTNNGGTKPAPTPAGGANAPAAGGTQ